MSPPARHATAASSSARAAARRRAAARAPPPLRPKPRRAAAPRSARAAPRPNAHLPERGVALRPCPSGSASTSRRRAHPASLSLAQPWRRGAAGGELRRRHAATARMPVGPPGQALACSLAHAMDRLAGLDGRGRGENVHWRARARSHGARMIVPPRSPRGAAALPSMLGVRWAREDAASGNSMAWQIILADFRRQAVRNRVTPMHAPQLFLPCKT